MHFMPRCTIHDVHYFWNYSVKAQFKGIFTEMSRKKGNTYYDNRNAITAEAEKYNIYTDDSLIPMSNSGNAKKKYIERMTERFANRQNYSLVKLGSYVKYYEHWSDPKTKAGKNAKEAASELKTYLLELINELQQEQQQQQEQQAQQEQQQVKPKKEPPEQQQEISREQSKLEPLPRVENVLQQAQLQPEPAQQPQQPQQPQVVVVQQQEQESPAEQIADQLRNTGELHIQAPQDNGNDIQNMYKFKEEAVQLPFTADNLLTLLNNQKSITKPEQLEPFAGLLVVLSALVANPLIKLVPYAGDNNRKKWFDALTKWISTKGVVQNIKKLVEEGSFPPFKDNLDKLRKNKGSYPIVAMFMRALDIPEEKNEKAQLEDAYTDKAIKDFEDKGLLVKKPSENGNEMYMFGNYPFSKNELKDMIIDNTRKALFSRTAFISPREQNMRAWKTTKKLEYNQNPYRFVYSHPQVLLKKMAEKHEAPVQNQKRIYNPELFKSPFNIK